jgi:hypothetical protein
MAFASAGLSSYARHGCRDDERAHDEGLIKPLLLRQVTPCGPSTSRRQIGGGRYDASAVMPRSTVPMLWTTSARSRENGVDAVISDAICSSSRAAAAVPSIAAR